MQNVEEFLVALANSSGAPEINPVVRDIMMNRTFSVISAHFPGFSRAEWSDWFQWKLVPLLPSLTAEMLTIATAEVDCDVYQVIVEGLDLVFERTTLIRKQEITGVLVEYLKGSGQVNGSGKFLHAPIPCRTCCHILISRDEELRLLNPTQIIDLTVRSGALNNTDLINRVFERLNQGDAMQNVEEFLVALANSSGAPEINPVVRDIMMNRTFSVISAHFPGFSRAEWSDWFQWKLVPLLPSLTAEMLTIATAEVDCDVYQVIVEGLDLVFERTTLIRKQEITGVLVEYLKGSGQVNGSGSSCGSGTNSAGAWLRANFGRYSVYVTLAELKSLNDYFSSFASLELLTPSQAADLTVRSGALNNTDLINRVFERLNQGDAMQNVEEFLVALANSSGAPEINPVVRDIMMNRTFSVISAHFPGFSRAEWSDWFQWKLVPLLPSLTAEMLTIATAEVDCDVYQVIVEGLDLVFERTTLIRKQEITGVLVEYLKGSGQVNGSGSSCGSGTNSAGAWLRANFGRYSVYVTLAELKTLNDYFSSFASLELLTPSQAADLTVRSGALNNTDLINRVFERLNQGDAMQNVEEFLVALANSSGAPEINPVVRDIMMNRTFSVISAHFPGFSRAEWSDWFQWKLVPLLPSLTAEMLTIATAEVDCDVYQVIVEGLDLVFERTTLIRKQEITGVLVEYLKGSGQVNGSGSSCGSGTNSAGAWLRANFGRYSVYVTLAELKSLNDYFSSFASLELLTPSQAADLTVRSGALNNTDLINRVFERLNQGDAMQNVEEFLVALANSSGAPEINPVVRDIMMNRTFSVISAHFPGFSRAEWSDWFQWKLVPLLPSLTAEMLTIATAEVDCDVYQVIVEGLDLVFERTTLIRKQEITGVLVEYLKGSGQVNGSGSSCGSGTNSAGAWLRANFGRYSVYVTLAELKSLNDYFSSFASLELLTPSQAADLTVRSGALNNTDLINRVFERLNQGDAMQNVEEFLVALANSSGAPEINPVVRDIMMNRTFSVISAHFPGFSRAEWSDWFQWKLVPLLPSLTAEMLTIATAEVDCDVYQVIVEGLDLVFERTTLIRKQEITGVLVEYLKGSGQVNGSGSSCGSGTNSAGAWLRANFGRYSVYVTLAELKSLNDYFSSFASLELLTPSQAADLTVRSGALNNTDLINRVFERLNQGDAMQNVEEFLVALANSSGAPEINPVVRDIMMNRTFSVISAHFPGFSRAEWSDWFQWKLVPLLPSLTAEMLTIATAEVDCDVYQVIVEGLDLVFERTTLIRKQEITGVLVEYLKGSGQVNGSGSSCGSGTNSAGAWLRANFGRYSVYVTLAELKTLNDYFSSFASLELLTPSQAADLTVRSGALNNTDLINRVFERLNQGDAMQNVEEFLVALANSSGAPEINPVVRDIMMNRTFSVISAHFPGFSRAEWSDWFQWKLVPLLPSLTAEMLTIATAEVDCDVYQVIVEGLDLVFERTTLIRKQEITGVLVEYLKGSGQVNGSGSSCGSGTNSAGAWLRANFGRYSVYVTLAELKSLNDYFSSFASLELLTPSQAADLTVRSGALNNTDLINRVFERLNQGDAMQNVEEFLVALANSSGAPEINPVVRDIMMNRTFSVISAHFPGFSRAEWSDWFQWKLVPLLPSLTAEMLTIATAEVDCDVYQVIVEGLDLVFERTTLIRKQEITGVLVEYLKGSGQVNGSGSSCGSGTNSAGAWLRANFGRYSVYVTLAELKSLNDYFSSFASLELLTPSQAADLTVRSGALNNTDLINRVFERLNQGDAMQNVEEFLVALANSSGAPEINPVVRDIMMNRTFSVISAHFPGFSRAEWSDWFQWKLVPLLPSLTAEMLTIATAEVDCDVYQVIVEGLDLVFERTTLIRKQEITGVLVEYLKGSGQVNGSGSSCGSGTNSAGAWLRANFGRYSVYVTLAELKTLNDYFSSFASLELLTPSQAADLTVRSGALNNTDLINRVFERLNQGDAMQNVEEFLVALANSSGAPEINPVVRDIMMNRTFSVISAHFPGFSRAEWSDWFQWKLVPLLPSLTAEMLTIATAEVDCDVYQVIVEGLDLVFERTTLIRKQEITGVLVEYLKGSGQVNGSGSSCGSGTNSAGAWLRANFGRYSVYVTLAELKTLNDYFSSFASLELLTPSQAADLTVRSGALNNTDLINRVFERLNQGDAMQNVEEFLVALANSSGAPEINPVVRDIMMNRTFSVISAHFPGFSRAEWSDWFQWKLVPLLPSLTAEMLTIATAEVDCDVYQVIVEGLDLVFERTTLIRKQEITGVLVEYLKGSGQVNGSGSSCGSGTNSAGAWLRANFGRYSVYVTLAELKSLNDYFSSFASLELLTPSQAADLTVRSGALNNTDLINRVFERLNQGDAMQNVEEFLVALANSSGAPEINPVVRDIMMNRTFSVISAHFPGFSRAEWSDWFQWKLVPLLPSLTAEMLTIATAEVDCDVYQVIVEGLDLVFERTTLIRKQEITGVLVEYLKGSGQVNGSGSSCGSGTNSAGAWLRANFGRYSVYVTLAELKSLNDYFSSFASLELLTPSQAADLTVRSGALNNTDLINRVFERLNQGDAMQNVEEFLVALANSSGAPEINPVVRDIMMNRTFSVISAHFPGFSRAEWSDWFQWKLVPLLPSLTAEMLTIATAEVDCDVYQVIVEGLDLVFERTTLIRKQEITGVLVEYLKGSGQVNGSGSSCGSGTNSAGAWLRANFGRYSVYVTLAELKSLNDYFSSFASLELLTPSQAADLTVRSGALNNTDLINRVFERLNQGDAMQNVEEFLVALANSSGAPEINPVVRDIMMNRTFSVISAHFPGFSRAEWSDWFQWKLVPLLPSLTAEMLTIATAEVDCDVYQVIVEGLDLVFERTTLIRKQEITGVLVEYLKGSGQVNGSGSSCGSGTNSAGAWLRANFGRYSVYVTLAELKTLNDYFSSFASLELLTPSQAADLTVRSGALNNTDLINRVFERLNQGDAMQNVEEFLVALANSSGAPEINPVVRDIMMNRTFSVISAHFPGFSRAEWSDWFQWKLVPLLPSLTAEMLTIATAEVDCDVYQVIVEGLDLVFERTTLIRKQEITGVLVEYLKGSGQVNGSGSSCGSGTNSAGAWLRANFGRYSVYVTLAELKSLNDYFSSFASLELLTPSQAADLTVRSGALNNTDLINRVFERLNQGDAMQNVEEFLVALANSSGAPEINPVVRDIMMNRTFSVISAHFPGFSRAEWSDWFQWKLVPLLPSLTAEMLTIATAEVDCDVYQVIVEGLDLVFERTTLIRKQEITGVLVEYLKGSGQVNGSGSSCGSGTNSAGAWLRANFGRYSVYVTLAELKSLNDYFSSFASLELLTPSQAADLTVRSGALNNTDLINRVFERLNQGDAMQNVEEFLVALANSSGAPEINPVVRDIMMNRTFSVISAHFPGFSRAEWSDWFQWKLVPLLPSLTAEMLTIATAEVDCDVYQVIVEGLDLVFERTTLIRKQEITGVLVEYLKGSGQVNGSGSSCGSGTNSAGAWLRANFGRYSVYVTLAELKTLNDYFSSFASLELLTPSQAADLTVRSGALNNTDLINRVFERLNQGDAMQNVEEFLVALANSSGAPEINPVVRDIMMNRTFSVISAHFPGFSRAEWSDWFQWKLVPLLPSLTAEMLTIATAEVDCDVYQVIVEGLDLVFERTTLIRKQEITGVLVEYLKGSGQVNGSGSSCGSGTNSAGAWLRANFGRYSVYVTLAELKSLNDYFSSFASLELLTPSQAADLTVRSGALNNTDLINRVFERLNQGDAMQNVEEFLVALANSSGAPEINPVVRDIMMNRTFSVISAHFPGFSRAEWSDWFQWKLVPLLPSLTAEMLTIATAEVDCDVYQVIVEGLDLVFERTTLIRKQEITGVLVEYLKGSGQVNGSGSSCGSGTNSAGAWLRANFGRYSVYVTLAELKSLNDYFSSFASLELLTPSQAADLTVRSGALNNTDLINRVFERLNQGDAMQNVEEFLVALANSSRAPEINPVVRDIMMNRTFSVISAHFPGFSRAEWSDWFQWKLVPLLPSLTAEMLTIATAEVDCDVYQVIVEGLDLVFERTTLIRKQEITGVLVEYLKGSGQVNGSDSSCGSGSMNTSSWLDVNFGKYSIYVTLEDLHVLHHGFANFVSRSPIPSGQSSTAIKPVSSEKAMGITPHCTD
ncbi:uncharacterized protein LOC118804450 [Colossoma macropomum]|uniref:uncharacterized protein LOC118804450 n=1 Tax=Colossoma macropomum TaxID=42526 RepID=UPI0018651C4B|nr:uncharacterized protein LOC118804450 [Colossoma macropomum]